MYEYYFTKTVTKPDAFNDYIKGKLLTSEGVATSDTTITVYSSVELTSEQQIQLASDVEAYVDPSYWLILDHSDNQFLNTNSTNSDTPEVLQSFIVSPYNNGNTVLGSMKTVVEYTVTDLNAFINWDESNPVIFTLEIFNLTQNKSVTTITQTLNDMCLHWKQHALNGDGSPQKDWKTLQIYGLKDLVPGSDCIWQFKVSISHPSIYISLNSVQRLYYVVQ